MAMNGQEWEDEQLKLDRDWYSHDDEGAVVSEDHLYAQFDDSHLSGAG